MISVLNLAHPPKMAHNAVPNQMKLALATGELTTFEATPIAPVIREMARCRDLKQDHFEPLRGLDKMPIDQARRKVAAVIEKIMDEIQSGIEGGGHFWCEVGRTDEGRLFYTVYLDPMAITPNLTARTLIDLSKHPVGSMALSIIRRHYAPLSDEVLGELFMQIINSQSKVLGKELTLSELDREWKRADAELRQRMNDAFVKALYDDDSPLSEFVDTTPDDNNHWWKALHSVEQFIGQMHLAEQARQAYREVPEVADAEFLEACEKHGFDGLDATARQLAEKVKELTTTCGWNRVDDLREAIHEAEQITGTGNFLAWLIIECEEKLPMTLTTFEEAAVEMVNYWAVEAGENGRATFDATEWSFKEVNDLMDFILAV